MTEVLDETLTAADLEAAVPALVDAGHRELVPSQREQQAGRARPAFRAAAVPQQQLDRGAAFRAYFQRLDPRTMTGGHSVVPLFLIVLTGSFGAIEGQLGLLIPEIQHDLGISIVTLTTMFSVLVVLSTLLGPIAGYMGDRVPRVRMLVVSNAGYGIGTILMTLVRSPLSFFGLQAARNVISAPSFPITTPLLSDFYPPETRGRIFSFQSVVTNAAGFIGLALVGVLGDRYGWRSTYVALAVPALVIGFALLFLKEPRRGAMDGGSGLTDVQAPAPGLAETLRICAGVKTLRRLWYAQPMLAFGGGGIYIILFLYLFQNFHMSVSSRAGITALASVATIVGLVVFAPVIDTLMSYRPGRILSLIGVLLIIDMALYLSMSAIPYAPYVVGVIFILALINAPTGPASAAIETSVIPARVRTLGMQLKPLFGLIGFAFVPVLGAVAQNIGFAAAFALTAPFYLIGGLLTISAGAQVEPDLRAARAANQAAEEAARHRRGESKKFLICRDVDVAYDGVQVLFHVDFDIEEGELVALLGTNGAGKSTLLRAVTGLTEASNGAIFLGGDDITHLPPYEVARRGVVLMPGGRGVLPGMTVAENLDLADWVGGKDTATRRRRVLDEFFPTLKARLSQKAGSLSGGEQQMLALAQAFIMDARLLLIDELSLGLAPAVVEQLLTVLREIRAGGTTVLMVEQSVELALRVADRAVFMEKGEVRFSGPASDLRGRQDLLRSVFLRGGGGATGQLSSRGGPRSIGREVEVVLEARGVATSYGGVRALDDVSLTVRRNEVVGIIGPNGAGKTTLFDALSGFLSLDAGEVVFAGKDVSLLAPDARARMGLTRAFQDSTLFPTLTVRETLMASLEKVVRARFAVMTATWTPAARQGETLLRRRANRLIEMFGLEPFADRFVVELSTGTRRILGMAVVVATEPEVVLLDEPSSGLAQTETEELGPLLKRVQSETGCGLVVIEHDMKLIRSVSDRLVAMDLGRVLLSGVPDDVLSDDRVVTAYLGGAAQGASGAQPNKQDREREGAAKEE
ncbi:MAG: hypothetical protein NVS3B24_06550 [Candidatus Dormibacteria bacterium]